MITGGRLYSLSGIGVNPFNLITRQPRRHEDHEDHEVIADRIRDACRLSRTVGVRKTGVRVRVVAHETRTHLCFRLQNRFFDSLRTRFIARGKFFRRATGLSYVKYSSPTRSITPMVTNELMIYSEYV